MKISAFLTMAASFYLAAGFGRAESVVSPEVHPDRSITFRLLAPNAGAVTLTAEMFADPQPMKKGPGGVWSLTTAPVEPDIYAYSFAIDGVRLTDPMNPAIKYNLFNLDSEVHVPGEARSPWEIGEVPHGVLHRHHYRSGIIGAERDVWVYTPPNYDPAKAYPVLYLLHGFSDAEDAWWSVGRANVILDNLIARGAAKPMLVVMPLGYGNTEVIARDSGVDWRASVADSNAKYGESIAREIVPLVESNYHVVASPEGRAIAGLSMGGTQATLFGLNAPDRFAWVGSFSAGAQPKSDDEAFPNLAADINQRLRLVWIACGTEDQLIVPNRELSAWLDRHHVKHTFVETPGTHSWRVWRRNLAQFAPLLFR